MHIVSLTPSMLAIWLVIGKTALPAKIDVANTH